LKNAAHIKSYLEGSLEGEELQQFEDRLKHDDNLAEELAEALIVQHNRVNLKDRLEGIHSGMQRVSESRNQSERWSMAAAIAIICVITVVLNLIQPMGWSNSLYRMHFETAPPIAKLRDPGSASVASLEEAMSFYINGDYVRAEKAFASLAQEQQKEVYNYYLVQSMLASLEPDYQEALRILDSLVAQKGGYYQQTLWYRALVHMKMGNLRDAKRDFTALSDQAGYKSKESNEILKQL